MNTREPTHRILVGSLIFLIALAGCLGFTQDDDPAENEDEIPDLAHAQLTTQNGDDAGTVWFSEANGRMNVHVEATNLDPGFHGFHVHETAACEPDFTAAGGHHNPHNVDHPHHAGEMPPLLVNEDGTAQMTFLTDRLTMQALFEDDGTAVIVHAGPDNFANIPDRYGGPDETTLGAGDAGPREACGPIQATDDMPDPTTGSVQASATLINENEDTIGEVRFTETPDGKIHVWTEAENLSPGFHGFHIHETGECEAPDFTSAGGHHNPHNVDHPHHAGDMPSLLVNDDGTANLGFITDRLNIEDAQTGTILEEVLDEEDDGLAVIVHAGPDNFANIPDRYGGPDEDTLAAGDAGPREACGVITLEDNGPI